MDAVGVENVSALEKIESLQVGIYHLEGFRFLDQVNKHLKKLSLGQTKSKKPDLSVLSRFESLEEIYLEGQQKNIDVLSHLMTLRDVTLRSISTPGLGYLSSLNRMWSLDIKLGGTRDLSALEGMSGIKYLELWQIRGLSDISVVSSLTGLQYLFLQSLRRVTKLPTFDELASLRRVCLENMKGLEDISSLETAPALEECILVSVTNLLPEDWLPLLRNPNLKRSFGGFGSDKRNHRFVRLMRENDVEPMSRPSEFDFLFDRPAQLQMD
jgi:hypothetical protein